MKKSLAIVLALMLVLSLSVVAFAAPVQNSIIISSDPVGFTVAQGQTLALKAVWETQQDRNREEWSIDGVGQGVASFDDAESGESDFLFDADGLSVGYYDVSFKIWKQKNPSSDPEREFEECEEVEVYEVSMTIYVAPMAAPNIAELILQYNEVNARWGKGKTGGNFIQEVAHEMGSSDCDNSGTDFKGVSKDEYCPTLEMDVSNSAYRTAVFNFLKCRVEEETGKEIVMPCDNYFAGLDCDYY